MYLVTGNGKSVVELFYRLGKNLLLFSLGEPLSVGLPKGSDGWIQLFKRRLACKFIRKDLLPIYSFKLSRNEIGAILFKEVRIGKDSAEKPPLGIEMPLLPSLIRRRIIEPFIDLNGRLIHGNSEIKLNAILFLHRIIFLPNNIAQHPAT